MEARGVGRGGYDCQLSNRAQSQMQYISTWMPDQSARASRSEQVSIRDSETLLSVLHKLFFYVEDVDTFSDD